MQDRQGNADAASTPSEDIVVYLPCSPENLPLALSLYMHQDMNSEQRKQAARGVLSLIRRMSPYPVVGILPEPGAGKTIVYVCHSGQTVREAIALASERPVVVWGWMLDELYVREAQSHVPVVFGSQNSPTAMFRLETITPSQPDPETALSTACYAFEYRWNVPPVDTTADPVPMPA